MYKFKESVKVSLRRREGEIKNIRSTHEAKWAQIRDHMAPDRYRPNTSDENRGERKDDSLIDNTPRKAARTLASGMAAGITPPTRPWKRIGPARQDQKENWALKNYCYNVDQVLDQKFAKGNLYKVLPIVYQDLGTFMTGAMLVERDEETLLHFTHLPIGSWWGSTNRKGRIDCILREFRYTVRQCIEEFAEVNDNGEIDWSNFSQTLQNLFKQNDLEATIDICHWIIPNPDYREGRLGLRGRKYLSYYYEQGATGKGAYASEPTLKEDIYLEVAGYNWFPVLAPRWGVVGNDTYAVEGPGELSLGDSIGLQKLHSRKFEGIDKQMRPPMSAPTYLKQHAHSTLPDKVTYIDIAQGTQKYEPLYQVKPDLSGIREEILAHEARINEAFFVDLFLMLTQSDRRDMTAREVEERHEEKLVMLGPVLTQVNQDMLDPLIEIAYEVGLEQGLFGEPPPEIQGEPLKIEYISVMAQAQKAVGVAAIQDTIMFVGQLAAGNPDAMDKLDYDQAIDEYVDARGTPPRMIRSDEQVLEMRRVRMKQQQVAQAAQNIPAMAGAAKQLSETDVSKNSALKSLIDRANAGGLVQAA